MAAVLFIIFSFQSYEYLSLHYLIYLGAMAYLIVQFFRVVINERKVAWMRPFVSKVFFFFFNIFLFFIILDQHFYFIGQFEDYNYTGVGVLAKDIRPGLGGAGFSALRSMTIFAGAAGMMLTAACQLRVIYSVFKYRQLPGRA